MHKKRKRNICGAVIRRHRKGNDWTQKEFAKRLREIGWKKCDRVAISRMESGNAVVQDIDLSYLHSLLGDRFTKDIISSIITHAIPASIPDALTDLSEHEIPSQVTGGESLTVHSSRG